MKNFNVGVDDHNGFRSMGLHVLGWSGSRGRDDSYITTSVKSKLASDKLVTMTRVEVETNNGIVYLTGQVETAEQRSHIGSLTSQVDGVKKVVNNLQVRKN
jgi:osmotically-inducible protein OsmY